ncbi:MAG: DUF4189 domain-containing protein [Devosia sp.]
MIKAAIIVFTMLIAGSAAAQTYGAIAYSSRTGAYGYSYDYSSRGAAERRALRECRKRAGGCVIATWFRNSCGALATAPRGGWGAHWGNNRRQAQRKALRRCRQEGNNNCRIAVVTCARGG